MTDFFSIENRSELPFQIYIGGRGIGKTYSTLSHLYKLAIDTGCKFLYLRRLGTETERCMSEIGNPFKRLNADKGWNVKAVYSSTLGLGTFTADDKVIGYASSLSTFYGLRSIDLSDVEAIMFEEFNSDGGRPIKNEGDSFFNMYETVNRNRELLGSKPVIVYFLSNAITMNNALLKSFNIVRTIERMIYHDKKRFSDKARGLYIELVESSVSLEKKDTAIYRLAGDNEFAAQALNNVFGDSFKLIRTMNIIEFKPFIRYGKVVICKHKSKDTFYATATNINGGFLYNDEKRLRIEFAPKYRRLLAYECIFFDSLETKIALDEALL